MTIEEIRDLTQRLRCKYPIGPIVNGEPEFGWRDCSGPLKVTLPTPIDIEAAEMIDRLRAELAEREGEIERLKIITAANTTVRNQFLEEIERLESLAASRLADQEGIERHTRKVVAGEMVKRLIEAGHERCGNDCGGDGICCLCVADEFSKKYGVE